ncbi:lipopolysaccharide biosynthesis protein [Hymenobacter monticola]|uniref:Polysaccharide biosynthesis protein n=1 Tax=Hymenobacter monticola TaxID=1705399 RepID=A0ABY4AZ98_9BACT|nr:hypothetical protein [Hymenobacter monticola]UOE31854.1 hypothetical protein MTP16_11980 [Hymenobacter monticola]
MVSRLQQLWQQNLRALRQPGSFTRNLAVTFSGSAAVTVIGFMLTPVMTRIYLPEAYGLFALFGFAVSNIALIATLVYPAAFVLPRERPDFLALVQLTLVLALGTLVLSSVIVGIWADELMGWLHAEKLGRWFYFVPLLGFVVSLNGIMASWYLRTKEFGKRVKVDVATNLAGRGLTIGYGLLTSGSATGLLLGDIFGKLVNFAGLLRGGMYNSLGELWRTFNWSRIKALAYEYREYPFYQLPTSYIGIVAAQAPILILTTKFDAGVAGLLAFCAGVIALPSTLMGNAIGPVFLQKASETDIEQPERVPGMVVDLYYKLFYVGLLPFTFLTVFGDVLFRYVFSARWDEAGIYAGYMAYGYLFQFMASATAPVFAIRRRQNMYLLVIVVASAVRVGGLALGALTFSNARLGILLMSVGGTVVMFLFDMYLLRLVRVAVLPVIVRVVVLCAVALVLFYGLRLGLESYWPLFRPRVPGLLF